MFVNKKVIYTIVSLTILFGIYFFFFKDKKIDIKNYPSSGTEIIAFGDSLVEGVGSTPNKDFVSILSQKIGKNIINLGVSGDTTEDGLKRISEIEKYNPKIVILLLGGNDALRRIPKEKTFNNLGLIIQNIQSKGSVVLLLGVKGTLLGDRYKSEFEKISKKYKTAYVPNVLDDLFGNPKFMSDGIHPNDAGYKIIAEKIYPELIPLLK
jgi:lysophospholipase L1-like esterase